MFWTFWTRKQIALAAAILSLAGTAVYLSAELTGPKPFAHAVLTAPWQCTRTAGILTVCSKTGA